ncbi:MAG: thermonuclease family protein [Acetobacterales bacterium]
MPIRTLPGLTAILLSGLVLAVGNGPVRAMTDKWPGVRVIDGDTLEIDGRAVQLFGIDTPELSQSCLHDGEAWPCGLDAAYSLHKVITLADRRPACERQEGDATACFADERNLSFILLDQGYAMALDDAPREYQEKERQARFGNLGIWRGSFEPPAEWRRKHDDGRTDAGPCVVRGRVKDGNKVYLVPTDSQYDGLPEDAAGDGSRRFCSDEAARAAGWRRPSQPPAR